MVTGFRHGKHVYFIQTDAVIFYERIQDFANKIIYKLKR